MDPNRIRSAEHEASAGDTPLNYGDIDFATPYQTPGLQENVNPSNQVNSLFHTPVENCDFPIAGYGSTWNNFMGNFNFPLDPVSSNEQLTPEQLAQLDEYLNSLSQADSSLSSGSDTATYAGQHSTDLSGNAYLDANAHYNRAAEDGRQLYTEAYNHWNLGNAPVENRQPSDGMYSPFGVQSEVFHSAVADDINLLKSNVENCASCPPENTTVTKPSFADVAKNKPIAVSSEPAVKIHQKNAKASKSARANGTKKESAGLKPIVNNHSQTSTTKNNSTRKNKSLRPANMQRSKSVPVEPSDIKPDSRYGLDTFEFSRTYPGEQRVTASCSNSRKNSSSSVSSGVSALDDIHWTSVRNVVEGGKHCDPQSTTVKPISVSNTVNGAGKESKNRPKKQEEDEEKVHPQHGENMFFDPRRIFQDSHEKTSKSDRKNNEDYVPNNKQKLQPDKENILYKEKPKASVKCDSKFINNDLRDNTKKHTNIDQERDQEKEHHHQGPKDSKPKSMNSTGSQSRNRVKTSKFDQNTSSKTSNKSVKRETTDKQYILGEYLLVVWMWFMWGCQEVVSFSWSLLKLLLSVTILLLAIVAHYTVIYCVKSWSWVKQKIPFLNKRNKEFDWTNGMPNPKQRQYGLKENINLPTTGSEAMKRLLSCKGKDPYCILGVRGDASDEDVKKYYRKQAVLVHPDKNQQPGAEEAFKILGHAFDLIGSVEKRQEYDSQIEKQDAETAMQEFADLLSKLHEKLQEASNLLRCDHCGGKHRRVPTELPVYSARFCDRCMTRHPAKEGDVWAESKMLGFLWHYFACMEGKVYDITEWASCKRDTFKSMNANSHQVMYRLSTWAGKGKGKTGEPSLEDFLSTLFHNTSTTGEGGAAASSDLTGSRHKANTGHQSQASKSKSGGGKKKKKKH